MIATSTTTFAYKARDRSGKLRSGRKQAETRELVVQSLRNDGLRPISVKAVSTGAKKEIHLPWGGAPKPAEVAAFARQLATMLHSGMTLARTLSVLAAQTKNTKFSQIITQIRLDVESGGTLSAALAKHPKVFNRLFLAMVRSGEIGGSLELALGDIATTLERQGELRRKVKSAMTYPTITVVVVMGIVSFMIFVIVPNFAKIFASLHSHLPLPTLLLLRISAIGIYAIPIMVVTLIVGTAGLRKMIATQRGRYLWDKGKLRVPVMKRIVLHSAMARFAMSLASLLRSGLNLQEALEVVEGTVGNAVAARAIHDATQMTRQGGQLSAALSATGQGIFPPLVLQMLAVGEESGSIEDMLTNVGEHYTSEVNATVDALATLIEPILTMIIGVVVGSIVFALYLPMLDMIKVVGKTN